VGRQKTLATLAAKERSTIDVGLADNTKKKNPAFLSKGAALKKSSCNESWTSMKEKNNEYLIQSSKAVDRSFWRERGDGGKKEESTQEEKDSVDLPRLPSVSRMKSRGKHEHSAAENSYRTLSVTLSFLGSPRV